MDEYESHEKSRYGAYSFLDSVKVHASIDWTAVRESVNQNPQLQVIPWSLAAQYQSSDRRVPTDVTRQFLKTTLQNLFQNVNLNLTQPQARVLVERLDNFVGVNINTTIISKELEFLLKNSVNVTGGLTGDVKTINVLNTLNAYGYKEYYFSIPTVYTVLHNTTSNHGIAAYTGSLVAAAFERCSGVPGSSYVNRNHPLPLTTMQSLEIKVVLSILTSLFMLIPLCYIPAAFVTFVIKERASKSKHLQIVSSVSPYVYWTATYLWDMCMYSILTAFVLIAFCIYGKSASAIFVGDAESAMAVFLLTFLYGLSSIPLSYIYSFAFENHSSGQISIMAINFMTGFVAVLAYYVLTSIPSTTEAGNNVVNFFRAFPPYNIGEGLVNLSVHYYRNYILGEHVSALNWYVTGRNIVIMSIEAVVYMAIVLLSESDALRRFSYQLDAYCLHFSSAALKFEDIEDEDVVNEKQRLQALRPDQQALYIQGLEKTYPSYTLRGEPKHALRGLNLGCAVGEVFGLLGVNGAGKSTTMGILTGDIFASSGSVFIAGLPLSNSITRSLIGYCPQQDPLLDLMTGHETLTFFGRIRGVDTVALEKKVHELIEAVGLKKIAHKPCGTYSGGNKRKLSFAVALIGDAKVLFLDEVGLYKSRALTIFFGIIYSLYFDVSHPPGWIRLQGGICGK